MVSSKNGPSSGSGLSKIVKAWSDSVGQYPFDRVLQSRNERLDQQVPVRRVTLPRHVSRLKQSPDAFEGATECLFVVGTNHPAAA